MYGQVMGVGPFTPDPRVMAEAVVADHQADGAAKTPSSHHKASIPVSARRMDEQPGRRSTRGSGELRITADAIVFSPFASANALAAFGELTHTERSIAITTAWLRPPWCNTFVMLQSNRTYLRLAVRRGARRRLGRALRETRVTVETATALNPPRIVDATGLSGRW